MRAGEAPPAGAITVAVLGPLTVAAGDRDLVVAGYRRRALVARLVFSRGSLVSANRLADDLWEDDPGRRSLPTLRTYVAKLRRLLPDGGAVLTSGPGGYALVTGPDALDAARFERAVRDAAGSPAEVERTLLLALAEWRGGAYEEFAHLSWARHEAVRLNEMRLGAQERLFDAQLALGRHAALVPVLSALASSHPLRERLHIQLVTALYRSGRQAEALAAQRRATASLVEDLGLDPSRELAELEGRILRQDPSLAAPDDGPVRVRGTAGASLPRPLQRRRGDPPFVGRAEELARLEGALDAVGSDGARLVVVRGEPGIGKTRLAAELGARAPACGATVLYGRCDEGIGAPYQPFVAALRELASRAPVDALVASLGDDPGALAALSPTLVDHLPGRGLVHTLESPATQRLRLFDAVAGWLRAATAAGPCVLVLEDVHWATTSTIMLARHVVRALSDRPVLVLATARSTAPDASPLVDGLVADLHRDGRVDVVDLAGLDAEAIDALIAAERGTAAPAGGVDRLRAATAGNPFLLTGLVRYGRIDGGAVPPPVKDVLAARIERLLPAVRDAVSVGGVAGVEFDVVTVAAALERGVDETISALDRAVAAGLLLEIDGAGGRYAFVHGIVQVAVADGHGPTRRAAVHAALAGALEARGGRADEIASHWRRAGPAHAVSAAEWSAHIGRQALAQLAYDDAAQHLATALTLDPGGDPAWRAPVLLDLATAHVGMGDAAAGRDALVEAAALARSSDDAVTLARAALVSSLGGRGVSGWNADAARVDLLAEARAALPAGERILRIRVAGELALTTHRSDDRARRGRLAREAVALAREDGSREARVAALPAARVAYWHPSDARRRRAHTDAALQAAEALGDLQAVVDALDWLAADAYELGDRAGFDAAVARSRELAAEVDGVVPRWRARVWETVLAATAGRLDEAESGAAAALAVWDGSPAPDAVLAFGAQLCMLRLLEGRAADAVDLAQGAAATVPTNAGVTAPQALVLAAAGRIDEAARLVSGLATDGLDRLPHDSQWLLGAVTLAEAAVLVGDVEAMALCTSALAPFGDRLAALAGPGLVWGSVAHQLGSMALALGRRDEAVAQLERACEVERAFGAIPWLARSEARLDDARLTRSRTRESDGVPAPGLAAALPPSRAAGG